MTKRDGMGQSSQVKSSQVKSRPHLLTNMDMVITKSDGPVKSSQVESSQFKASLIDEHGHHEEGRDEDGSDGADDGGGGEEGVRRKVELLDGDGDVVTVDEHLPRGSTEW
jgi:hypothetical protein